MYHLLFRIDKTFNYDLNTAKTIFLHFVSRNGRHFEFGGHFGS